MLAGGVVFLDRGSANQFFVAIFIALGFLVVDTFVRPYHDFRCNALKVLTSMSMLITLLCGFASKLDWRNEVVSDDTLGWTLIVSGRNPVYIWPHEHIVLINLLPISNRFRISLSSCSYCRSS